MIAAAVLVLGLAVGHAARPDASAGRKLAKALLAERFTAGRLAGQTAWHACVPADPA